MNNVLDITSHLPERPPLDVEVPLQIVTRMLQVGAISRHAYGIGLMVLARMQADETFSCELTRQDFERGAVRIDGEPAAALCNMEIGELAMALHALQYNCGFWNHVAPARVGKGKERYNHFTEQYRGEGDFAPLRKIIQHSTSVHFCWLPERQDEIVSHAKVVITQRLAIAQFADIRTVRIHKC